jgi:NAD(P)-dependent dehydrogenase (short-subunit alcohol dehydrogenase family)
LVTGGGSGIGKAFCHALGEAGSKVAVVDINLASAQVTVDELKKKGIEAIAIKTDVTNEEAVEAMVQTVVQTFGSLTIAVNNAGMGIWSDALTMPFETWRKTLALNLDAIFLCARG